MKKQFTLSVFTEHVLGMLTRLTVILTRRQIQIESITACECELEGVCRYTIVINCTEEQAKKNNFNYTVNFKETTNWYSSRRLNEPVSAFKVLIDKKTDGILGAHLLGNNAEETINIFALAMNNGVKAKDLKKTIFSYPTNASDVVYML